MALPPNPVTGPTGATVVKAQITTTNNGQVVHYNRPAPPNREVAVEWTEDGEVIEWRELSEEEFAEATRSYGRCLAEWERTGGRFVAQGPIVSEVDIECSDGSAARGMWSGKEWVWLETREPCAAS